MDIFPTFSQILSRLLTGVLWTIFVILGIYAAFLLVTWWWLLGVFIALPLLVILGAIIILGKDFWWHWFDLAVMGSPSLVVDERGIFDNSKTNGVGLVPWQCIERIAFDEQMWRIELYLQEDALEDWRLQWPLKISYELCRGFAQTRYPISLSMAYIGYEPDELLRIIREHKTTIG